ncbi:MAG: hypothetical protein KAR05_12105 [Candidatus Omnitrophica bacterium]|nr:hypothetical protein [Candidatus Omnitrophota bacterium]
MKPNKDEKEMMNGYEKGDSRFVPNVNKEIGKYRAYAKSASQKNKRINIRILFQ